MEKETLVEMARQIYEKEKAIAELNKSVKDLKERIKKDLKEKEIMQCLVGDYAIIIKDIPETKIADTDAMKAAGIFDEYSKLKAGYTSVSVKLSTSIEAKGK